MKGRLLAIQAANRPCRRRRRSDSRRGPRDVRRRAADPRHRVASVRRPGAGAGARILRPRPHLAEGACPGSTRSRAPGRSTEKIEDDQPHAQVLRLVEIAQRLADVGLQVEQLDYILRHRYVSTEPLHPGRRRRSSRSQRPCADGIRAIRTANAVPDDPGSITEERLRPEARLDPRPRRRRPLPRDAERDGAVYGDEGSGRLAPGGRLPRRLRRHRVLHEGAAEAADARLSRRTSSKGRKPRSSRTTTSPRTALRSSPRRCSRPARRRPGTGADFFQRSCGETTTALCPAAS